MKKSRKIKFTYDKLPVYWISIKYPAIIRDEDLGVWFFTWKKKGLIFKKFKRVKISSNTVYFRRMLLKRVEPDLIYKEFLKGGEK